MLTLMLPPVAARASGLRNASIMRGTRCARAPARGEYVDESLVMYLVIIVVVVGGVVGRGVEDEKRAAWAGAMSVDQERSQTC